MEFTPEQIEQLIKIFDQRYAARTRVPMTPGELLYRASLPEPPNKKKRVLSTLVDLDQLDNYLLVPYEDKDEAKALGASFCNVTKLWYIPDGFSGDREAFKKWRQFTKIDGKFVAKESETIEPVTLELASIGNVIYLSVPYEEKDEVKALGAQFDGNMKSWYIPEGYMGDKSLFQKWKHFQKVDGKLVFLGL